MLHNFLNGLSTALSPISIIYVAAGVLWGIIGGAIPGISGSVAMALLLPLTYGMEPLLALPLLCAVYVGAEYGGSIPAVLIKTPGTGSNAPTAIDGYEMQLQGRGGEALFTSLYSSFVGGVVSVILLVIFAVPLASFGLKFGPSQYMLVGILGLSIVGSVSGKSQLKGLISALFGLILATVGMDPISAAPRFTFGQYKLIEGFNLIPLIVGLFAVSEVFRQIFTGEITRKIAEKAKIKFPAVREIFSITPISILCGMIGTVVGVLPGAGASIASWLCYSQAKNFCKNTETFGSGDIRGVAAPEAGNNAVPAGALVPLLALGVPGSNSTAILLAGFSLQGIAPGPLLFTQHPEVPYTIMACMLVAQFVMLALGTLIIRPAVKITSVDKSFLSAAVIMFAAIGSFSINNDAFGIILAFIFGLVGFFMKRYGFAPAATVLGFVLGELIENNLRRSLALSKGAFAIFIQGTLNQTLLVLIVLSFCLPLAANWLKKRRSA